MYSNIKVYQKYLVTSIKVGETDPRKRQLESMPLFIAMRVISNTFHVHTPSSNDELRVGKKKNPK